MKKIILFSLGLFSFFGAVKGEEVATPKPTVYEDVKKHKELSIRATRPFVNLMIKHQALQQDVAKNKLMLDVELLDCESAGNCEESEELALRFRELAKSQVALHEASVEILNIPEYQEVLGIYSKYQH